MFSKRPRAKMDHVACIFVHAGAGYHSVQNEGTHLQACNEYVIILHNPTFLLTR